MSNGRIPRITAPAKTDLVIMKVDPFGGFPTTEGSPVEDFFAHIPSPVVLTGDGRVYNHVYLPAAKWTKGVSAPSDGFVGIYPTLEFDALTDDEAHYTQLVPFRMEDSSCITVKVDWAYTGGADAGTVCWVVVHKCIEPGEAVAGGGTTITETSVGTHTSGQLVRTIFTDQLVGCVAHDNLGLHLYRDVSEDSLATDAEMIAIHLEFIRDKHGEAI